ncbi:uncharacterized protein [Euphorbia lathyris]|uniref:uncharacterized protein isoform X4 n=1 Tax=Euphorbia lathyris TaxID=212925 RepID=UPI003313CDC8
MILPKAAETHLPTLESKEGILISMDDLDGLHVWSFKYSGSIRLVQVSELKPEITSGVEDTFLRPFCNSSNKTLRKSLRS